MFPHFFPGFFFHFFPGFPTFSQVFPGFSQVFFTFSLVFPLFPRFSQVFPRFFPLFPWFSHFFPGFSQVFPTFFPVLLAEAGQESLGGPHGEDDQGGESGRGGEVCGWCRLWLEFLVFLKVVLGVGFVGFFVGLLFFFFVFFFVVLWFSVLGLRLGLVCSFKSFVGLGGDFGSVFGSFGVFAVCWR